MFTSSFARPRLLSAALAFLMVAGVLVSTARSSAAAVAVNEVYSVPSSRAFPLAGRGFGHGRGMSQYGARARAEAGQSLSTILGFYYPGTAAGDIGNPSVRVILTNAGKEGITSGTHRFECDYASSEQRENCGITLVPQSGLQYRRIAAASAWATLPSTVGGNTVTLWGAAPTGDGLQLQLKARTSAGWVSYGAADATGYGFQRPNSTTRMRYLDASTVDYRGQIEARRTGATTIGRINVLGMQSYLSGVVPGEMISSWHIVALGAQSVAARTFAWFEALAKPAGALFHTCDSTSCQVYRGASAETDRTNQAVADTYGDIRTYGGQPAFTQFSASNGGYSSAGAYPYLVSRADPYDDYPAWTTTMGAATLEATWPAVGTLRRLEIYQREGGTGAPFKGRVQQARLVGSGATVDVTGDALRSATGLKSTLFGVRQEDPHALFGAAAYAPGAADLVTRSTTGWPLHRTWRDDTLRPFRSLGGGTEYAPAVVLTPPARLDAFVVGRGAGALYTNSRATASSAWTGWASLGGSFTGRPAAVPSGGYVDVFAHGTDGNLWHRWRQPSGQWAAWRVLVQAAPIASDAGLGAATGADGLQHVFFRDLDGSLRVVTRTLATDSWTLRDLGGGLIGDPTAASASTGRVTVVLRGTNDFLYAKDLTGATGVGAFVNLGGALAASPVAFAVTGSNRVDVLVNHNDGLLYRRTRSGTSWSAWTRAG